MTKEKHPIYFGATRNIIMIARELRNNMTDSEKLLWERLRKRQLKGFKFRRQHPIDQFIVDFFCYEAMLSIELDGEIHQTKEQRERDIERTKILNQHGVKEIRFTNHEVNKNLNFVVQQIKDELSVHK